MLGKILLPVLAATGAVAQETYDYIVVGSGPGGGPLASNLARGGYSVLLLDAGDDQSGNANTSQIFNFNAATNDEKTRWDFFVKHSDDEEQENKYERMVWRKTDGSFYVGLSPPEGAQQLGIWYPRTGTLGGCAMHNAGVTALPADDDWNYVANITGDESWAADNMRKYFVQIERNTFLPNGTAGHGFNGWLTTSAGDVSWVDQGNSDNAQFARQLATVTEQDPNQLAALLARDINADDPDRDQTTGFFNMVTHASAQGLRSSPNQYIKSTVSGGFPLTVQLNSLVTRVLFDEEAEEPTAVGVEVMTGKSSYEADPRHKAGTKGNVTQIFAKNEVIISGGTFNSPQILKLSGIGPAAELQKFNISVVQDLPGVGENMADNYEGGLLALANRPIQGLAGTIAVLLKTASEEGPNRNIFAWCGSFSFEGFWPGMPENYGPQQYECAIAHMNPRSQAGSVRLRSADPQEVPDINFRFFAEGGDKDLTEILDAVKLFREAFHAVPGLTPWNEKHPCPGTEGGCSDEEQKEYLKTQAYSHHPTSSNAIGADDDPLAVLDSKFRVRGVKNLRVVDASAFPKVPGAFPVIPTMMISHKASEVILAEAGASERND